MEFVVFVEMVGLYRVVGFRGWGRPDMLQRQGVERLWQEICVKWGWESVKMSYLIAYSDVTVVGYVKLGGDLSGSEWFDVGKAMCEELRGRAHSYLGVFSSVQVFLLSDTVVSDEVAVAYKLLCLWSFAQEGGATDAERCWMTPREVKLAAIERAREVARHSGKQFWGTWYELGERRRQWKLTAVYSEGDKEWIDALDAGRLEAGEGRDVGDVYSEVRLDVMPSLRNRVFEWVDALR